MTAPGGQQAQGAARGEALARAGLADERDGLAGPDGEVDPVEDGAGRAGQGDPEPSDVECGPVGRVHRSLLATRSAQRSPTTLNATTVSTMRAQGRIADSG
ncbi:hypothetical protein GCM10019017_15380 [Streptomyces showdoensis]